MKRFHSLFSFVVSLQRRTLTSCFPQKGKSYKDASLHRNKPPPSSLPVNKRNKQTKRTNNSNTQSNHHRNEQQRLQRKEQKTSWSKSSNKQRPIQRIDRRRSKTIQPQRLKPRTKTGSNHNLVNGGERRRKPRKRMKTEMERVQTKRKGRIGGAEKGSRRTTVQNSLHRREQPWILGEKISLLRVEERS